MAPTKQKAKVNQRPPAELRAWGWPLEGPGATSTGILLYLNRLTVLSEAGIGQNRYCSGVPAPYAV
jgi:hypothetical protein